jgi:hypothetical protein
MKLPRSTTAAVTMTFPAVLLVMLAACGGQPGQPAARPSPSASTSAAAPSQSAVPSMAATPSRAPTSSQPASGAPSPVQSARVLSSRLAYPWHWPNDVAAPGRVTHASAVPPVPELVQISVGSHPGGPGERPFNRMSFTFSTAFPSYRFEFASKLVSDPSGKVIPLGGQDVLEIVFTQAQAHTADGTRSSVISQPAPRIGYQRMAGYARGGDFEGVLTYGIGITRPVLYSNPQFAVRAYEVETVTASGQHRYTVAIDIDASNLA